MMNEPEINVGILSAPVINFELKGDFTSPTGDIVTGAGRVRYADGKVEWRGQLFDAVEFHPTGGGASVFQLDGVTIGVGFHWERQESQRFAGSLTVIPDAAAGSCVAINRVAVDEYLKSVISSEMSAGSSPALLQAHAVVSRSWLLRQLADRGKYRSAESVRRSVAVVDGMEVEEIVKWYDREDHTLFDVCADDHCQRYQGLTRQTSPAVAAAVDATKGLVLTFGGEICDARFSKCCGGKSETFGNCWEDAPHLYLEPVDDCDDSGDIFCCNPPAEVIRQVLNGYDRESPDFYEWEERYSAGELSELVKERSGIDFGEIRELRPLTRGASGRIVRLFVGGTRHSAVVGKELEIRRWLSPSHLKSSWFDVERTSEGEFVLRGRGWGHGVGMCQIGAAVMGSRGYDMRAILHHYFPKAELTKIY